jgi:chaperonin GroEL (HSP60 family)
MKVTIKENFKAVDGSGKEYYVWGIEMNERSFWSKDSDRGWENVFTRELRVGREMDSIRIFGENKITVRPCAS